jgi:hypothetical protein
MDHLKQLSVKLDCQQDTIEVHTPEAKKANNKKKKKKIDEYTVIHDVYIIPGSYGVGVFYAVSYLSRIYPYFSNCSV